MSGQLPDLRAMERMYKTSTLFPSWDGLESSEKSDIVDAARNVISLTESLNDLSVSDGSSRQKKKKQEKLQENEGDLRQWVGDWARRPRPSLPMDTDIPVLAKDARKALQTAYELVVEGMEDEGVRDEAYAKKLRDTVDILWEELQPLVPEKAEVWEPMNAQPSRHEGRDGFALLGEAPSPAEAARREDAVENARIKQEEETRMPEVDIMADTAGVATDFEAVDAEAVADITAPIGDIVWWGSAPRDNVENLIRRMQENATTVDDKEEEEEEEAGDGFIAVDNQNDEDPDADYVP